MYKIDIIVIVGIVIVIGVSIYTITQPNPESHINKISKTTINKVNITKITVTDEFGFNIKNIRINQIILLQVDIVNLQNVTQPFVSIVKVQGTDGVIYSILFNKSELSGNGKISIANSWIPQKSGEYIVYVFVWSDIDGREVLAPKASIKINVVE